MTAQSLIATTGHARIPMAQVHSVQGRANSSVDLTLKNSLTLNTSMKKKPCLDFDIFYFSADGMPWVASMQLSACSDHS